MPDEIDFETGRLTLVAATRRPRRIREYLCLFAIVGAASIPYVLVVWWRPLAGALAIAFLAVLQTLAVFMHSARGGVSHSVRFQLAGSNPFAMTGGMAMLLGGVDTLLDVKEDRAARRRNPLAYGAVAAIKVGVCPLGLPLMACEFMWDLVLQGRAAAIVGYKLQEFFRVAHYHDIACPEKSNDIFYADLALARLQDRPFLYQWHRLRAMMFELQQSDRDIRHGAGSPDTNLLRQPLLAAYRSVQRLKLREIEQAVEAHFATHLEEFPLRPLTAKRLLSHAKPLERFLSLRDQWGWQWMCEGDRELLKLVLDADPDARQDLPAPSLLWTVLRVLDADGERGDVAMLSMETVDSEQAEMLLRLGILESAGPDGWRWTQAFQRRWEAWLQLRFEVVDADVVHERKADVLPLWWHWRDQWHVPRAGCAEQMVSLVRTVPMAGD